MTEITTSHAASTSSLSKLADEQAILESKQQDVRSMIEEAEGKRGWFDAFREWVETVATFLDEKVSLECAPIPDLR